MKRIVLMATVALVMAAMLLAPTGVASADPVNAPKASFGTLVCDGTTYNVVSAGNRTLTASDTNSTSQVLIILDKAPGFPRSLLTECTAFPPPPDEPFTAYFLITPVR